MKKKHMVLFAVILALFIATSYIIAADYTNLPDRIPTHFDVSGNPDSWGSKNYLLLYPGFQALFLVISSVVYRYPNYMNIPGTIALKYLTKKIRERECMKIIRDILLIVMGLVSFLMFYLAGENLEVAKGLAMSMNLIPVWIILACLIPPIVYYAIKMRRLS